MAKRIAGITIEIGGDTTKLTKSLEGVDKQIGKNRQNLQDIEKLLKLDPGNVELLTQKQKNLNEETKAYKERLEKLKSVSKESLSQEEWDNLQREIVDTEQKLDMMKDQMKDFGSVTKQQLQAAGKKISDVGDKISGVGEKFLPVTGAIAGLGAAGVASMMELDAGYDTIITKTGATGETLDGLNEQFERVFGEMPVTAEQAGIAIGEVNTRFGLTGESLGTLSEQFIQFAEINGTDLNNSIDQVDKVMAQFGLDSEDAGNVLGLLTKVGQDTGLSMDTLYGSLEKNGQMFRDMGLDLPEATTLLGNFESAGLNTDVAIQGLQKAYQNANKEGKDFNTALNEGITAIQNATTDTEALQIATDLFGKKAAPEMAAAIKDGKINLDDLSSSIEDYGSVVSDTYESTQDPWDKLATATNELKLAGADLAGTMLETLQPAIDTAVGAVKTFTEWLGSLDEDQKQTIVTIGAVVAAIGPAIMIVGKITSAIGAATSAIGLLASPIGIAVVAIGALVAAGVLLYKNWDKVKEFANKLKENLSKTFENIKTGVTNKIDTVKTNVTNKFNEIKTGVTNTVDNIKTAVSQKFDDIKNSIKEKMDFAKETVSGIIDKIKGFFNFSVSWPHIPLPHFGISPSGWSVGDLLHGSIPKLDISWYRSAMGEGQILNQPTIFGYSNGRLLGGGEAGAEAIVGVNSLRSMIQDAVGNTGDVTIVVNGAPGQDVNALAEIVSRKLNDQINRRRAVYA